MEEILRSQWNYMLCRKDGELVFSVICGSVAIYEINIFLNKQETENYHEKGEEYLNELADRIRNNPGLYKDRHIDLENEHLN